MPTLRQCAEDKSWRVRYMVADKFTELQVFIVFMIHINDGVHSEKYSCTYIQGCCRQRDHKDRPGSRLPIPSQRLRSRGDLLFEIERHG